MKKNLAALIKVKTIVDVYKRQVESVALGVYEAVVSAMSRQSEQSQQATITILLDGEQIYQNQEEIRRNKGYSFGMGPFAR